MRFCRRRFAAALRQEPVARAKAIAVLEEIADAIATPRREKSALLTSGRLEGLRAILQLVERRLSPATVFILQQLLGGMQRVVGLPLASIAASVDSWRLPKSVCWLVKSHRPVGQTQRKRKRQYRVRGLWFSLYAVLPRWLRGRQKCRKTRPSHRCTSQKQKIGDVHIPGLAENGQQIYAQATAGAAAW